MTTSFHMTPCAAEKDTSADVTAPIAKTCSKRDQSENEKRDVSLKSSFAVHIWAAEEDTSADVTASIAKTCSKRDDRLRAGLL